MCFVVMRHTACGAGGVIAEVQQYIKARALECEECIFTASGQADAPEEPETTETGDCCRQLLFVHLTIQSQPEHLTLER